MKKNKKTVIISIAIILITITAIYAAKKILTKMQSEKNITQLINKDKVIDDFDFDQTTYKNNNDLKGDRVGMALRTIVIAKSNGKALIHIKNSGTVQIAPKVIFNNENIYQSPIIKPGQTIEANVNFGRVKSGEYKFNVFSREVKGNELARATESGAGLSIKCTLIVK